MTFNDNDSPMGDLDLECHKEKVFDGPDSTYNTIRSLLGCIFVIILIIVVTN